MIFFGFERKAVKAVKPVGGDVDACTGRVLSKQGGKNAGVVVEWPPQHGDAYPVQGGSKYVVSIIRKIWTSASVHCHPFTHRRGAVPHAGTGGGGRRRAASE